MMYMCTCLLCVKFMWVKSKSRECRFWLASPAGEGTDWEVVERRLLFIVLLIRACWHHQVRALPLTPKNCSKEQQPLRIKQATILIEVCVCPCVLTKQVLLFIVTAIFWDLHQTFAFCSFMRFEMGKLEHLSCTHKSYDIYCLNSFYATYSYILKPVLVLSGC